jgi:fatty acid desaturase
MHPRARRQRLEIFIGVLGFFALIALLVFVVDLVRRGPLLQPGFVLVGTAFLFGYAIRLWRRMPP